MNVKYVLIAIISVFVVLAGCINTQSQGDVDVENKQKDTTQPTTTAEGTTEKQSEEVLITNTTSEEEQITENITETIDEIDIDTTLFE